MKGFSLAKCDNLNNDNNGLKPTESNRYPWVLIHIIGYIREKGKSLPKSRMLANKCWRDDRVKNYSLAMTNDSGKKYISGC